MVTVAEEKQKDIENLGNQKNQKNLENPRSLENLGNIKPYYIPLSLIHRLPPKRFL